MTARRTIARVFHPPSSTPDSRTRVKNPRDLTRPLLSGSIALVLFVFAPAFAPAAERPGNAPAVNWVLPIFTDKEGYRSMTLRGSEVRPSGKNVAVTDLSITIFSGDAAAKVDSILLSSEAFFLPKEQRASGEKSVRFIRGDIDVTGEGWTYDHAAKKITLKRNVRVTFTSQLNDILK